MASADMGFTGVASVVLYDIDGQPGLMLLDDAGNEIASISVYGQKPIPVRLAATHRAAIDNDLSPGLTVPDLIRATQAP